MKTLIPSLLTAMTFTTLFSCQKEVSSPTTTTVQKTMVTTSVKSSTSRVDNTSGGNLGYTEVGCPAVTVPLLAGQFMDAGTISVSNDNEFIYVTYTTANGYLLTETHLYVGNCSAVPVNKKGNPVPGQFPYKDQQNYTTSFTYKVPIASMGLGQCGCIAAHAALVKLDATGKVIESQTGWGACSLINATGGNWGTKFSYCTCEVAGAAD